MMFPADFLETLRSRLILSEIISQQIRLQKRGREYLGLCPFHKEKTPSFTVNDEKGLFYCFGCGAHGDAISFIMQSQNISFSDTVANLAEKTGLAIPQESTATASAREPQKHQLLYTILEDAASWFQAQLMQPTALKALEYLQKRGLTLETIQAFRLGYAPANNGLQRALLARGYNESMLIEAGLLIKADDKPEAFDRFRNRIMFPILNKRNQVIAFGGRILGDGQPKYLNSPESLLFAKRRTLYKSIRLSTRNTQDTPPFLIVEGYMDVIALNQAGFYNTVAPLGTALTEEQLQEIWKISHEPILCFDGDEAGTRAAYRAANRALPLLKPGYSLQFVTLPQGEDPDSLVRSGDTRVFNKIVSSPQSLIEILWQNDVLKQRTATPEQLALVRKNFEETLKKIQDSSIRYLYKKAFDNKFFKLLSQTSFQSRQKKSSNNFSEANLGVRTLFDPQKRQRYILFAILLNHCQLLHDVGEQFAALELPEPEFEKLRDDLFLLFNHNPDLDVKTLKPHLLEQGHLETLNKILTEDIYLHASFARPEASLEAATKGWKDIWQFVKERGHIKSDVSLLRNDLENKMTLEAWSKFRALTEQSLLAKKDIFEDESEKSKI
jgi:DNA primase